MGHYTVFNQNAKGTREEYFSVDADFLPRIGDVIWVDTSEIDNRYKKQLKVILIEHSVRAMSYKDLFSPELDLKTLEIKFPEVSYNVIAVEVDGVKEAEKIEKEFKNV